MTHRIFSLRLLARSPLSPSPPCLALTLARPEAEDSAVCHDAGMCVKPLPGPQRLPSPRHGRCRHAAVMPSACVTPLTRVHAIIMGQGYWYEMAVVIVDGRVEASDEGVWRGEYGCGHWINGDQLVDGLVNPVAAITTCDTFATEYTELLQISQQGDDSASLHLPRPWWWA
jgi:hypothetical protein